MELIFDYIGSFAFAVSGIRLSAAKGFDWLGAMAVGFLTMVGGGTLRDILLGVPAFWLFSPHYLIILMVALPLTILLRKYLVRIEPELYAFDAIGLGLFTVIGIEKTLLCGYSWWVAILFGVISGCVGGILRDVTINETPLIFRKEIYALACLIGGAVYFLLTCLCVPNLIVKISVAVLIIAIRMVSLKYGVNLRNISELIS